MIQWSFFTDTPLLLTTNYYHLDIPSVSCLTFSLKCLTVKFLRCTYSFFYCNDKNISPNSFHSNLVQENTRRVDIPSNHVLNLSPFHVPFFSIKKTFYKAMKLLRKRILKGWGYDRTQDVCLLWNTLSNSLIIKPKKTINLQKNSIAYRWNFLPKELISTNIFQMLRKNNCYTKVSFKN